MTVVLEESFWLGEDNQFRLRLLANGRLAIDHGTPSQTWSVEVPEEAMRRFALAAAQLRLRQLKDPANNLLKWSEGRENVSVSIPLAELDRIMGERIEGVPDEDTIKAYAHSQKVVNRLQAQGLDQWDAWDSLRFAAESLWQSWTMQRGGRSLERLFNVLKNALERIREEELQPKPEEFEEDPDRVVSPIFQGVHADRLADNADERAAAQLWEAENTQAASLQRGNAMVSSWDPARSLLGRLLSRDEDRGIRPSTRDWLVANTVVQWLGTARGSLFFTQLQMAVTRKRDE